MSGKNVIVTFAASELGQFVVLECLKAGHSVRAITLDPRSKAAKQLAEAGAEIIRGIPFDVDQQPMVDMCVGMDYMILCTPFLNKSPEAIRCWCAAAKRAGCIKHIMRTVAPLLSHDSDLFEQLHMDCRRAIYDTGIVASEVCSTFMVQSWAKLVCPVIKMMARNPWGGLRSSWMDASDVGKVCAALIGDPENGRQTFLRGEISISHRTAFDRLERGALAKVAHMDLPISRDEWVPRGSTSSVLTALIYHSRANPWDWAATNNGAFESIITSGSINMLHPSWREDDNSDTRFISTPTPANMDDLQSVPFETESSDMSSVVSGVSQAPTTDAGAGGDFLKMPLPKKKSSK